MRFVHHILRLSVLSLLLACQSSQAESIGRDLPVFGDSVSGLISLETEKKIGKRFLTGLRRQTPTNPDPLIKEYVEYLIYNLSTYSEVRDREFEIMVIQDPRINAFAAPGGIIGVNTGIFLYAESEDELASILGHELAHLSQRHFARRIADAQSMSMPQALANLAGLVVAAAGGADAGLAAITGAQGVAQSKLLSYSRQRETEADRLGLETMSKAGLNPQAMPKMFERLAKLTRSSRQIPEFLRTHPLTERRVADTRNLIISRYEPKKLYQPNIEYLLMRARVRLSFSDNLENNVTSLKRALKEGRTSSVEATTYELALALIRLGKTKEAQKYMDQLRKNDPDRITYIATQAELYNAEKAYDDAIELLKNYLEFNPNNYPMTMLYTQTLINKKNMRQAELQLREMVSLRPTDSDIWFDLAETAGLSGNIMMVHQARAEYFVLFGAYDRALQQIDYAQKLVEGNFQMTTRLGNRAQRILQLQQGNF